MSPEWSVKSHNAGPWLSAKVFGLYTVEQREVGGIEGLKQGSRMAIFAS